MQNIAQPQIENKSSREGLKSLINSHYTALIGILIAILTITALIGLWRLRELTPRKSPINIEYLR